VDTLPLIQKIIQGSDREHPADAVLRSTLKAQRALSREEGSEISRAVFAFYRWRGWLRPDDALASQLEQASALARKYALAPSAFKDDELIRYSLPSWVTEVAEITPAFARALQQEPRIWLRARPGQGREVAETLWDCSPFGKGPLADVLEYKGTKDLFRTRQFHAGHFELQDLSSIAVGLVCAPKPGETWWDACAGEGGKTLHLADLMQNRGLIWATDRAEWRLRRLRLRTARAHVFNYRSALWNAEGKLPTKTVFDGVLVDAPCSGIGTWHRNPHARWTSTRQDVSELADVQKRLLHRASSLVKPGGKLAYATCTVTREDTTGVAQEFEKSHPDFLPLVTNHPLDAHLSASPVFQFWPQDFGGNGLFVAVWRRAEA